MSKHEQIAPNVVLIDDTGIACTLDSFWYERPTLLFFMRHYGCSVCRAQLFRVRDVYAQITALGGQVVVITQTDYELTQRFMAGHHLPFPVLSDPTLAAYHAFGLWEGRVRDVLGPTALLSHTQEALKGNPSYFLPGFSVRQLGGVFIVDTSGMVHFAHIAHLTYNYPDVATYIDVFSHINHTV